MAERSSCKSAVNHLLNVSALTTFKLGNAAVFPAAAHMSLAIEALRQICQTEGAAIHGVTLRDVDIKTALVIPEKDNGIEIQLRFQELARGEKSTMWYSFAVESITAEQWTTHCEGRIAANHNVSISPRKLESPVSLSKLTHRVPGKRWYQAFNRVGFEYGPTFQPLSQIRTNGKDHGAAANVDVATKSGVMDAESRYILHPSTIDACLQLIIISINAGLHKEMACGVVPLQMEEVNLWFPNEEAGARGHAIAWTDEFNGRYYNTHTKLATESGEMVLDVKSLRCVSYEAAAPQNATQARKREPYMEVSWKPDVTSLTPSQAVRLHPHVQSEIDATRNIVELINHKSAIDSVLLLGESLIELVEALRQLLPTTTAITLGLSAKALENSQSSIQDDQISTHVLSEDLSEWSETISDRHGLLVLGESILRDKSQMDLLNTIKPFIAENGSLVSIVRKTPDNDYSKALSFCGYSGHGFQYNASNTSVFHSQLSVSDNNVRDTNDKVIIVSMDPQRPLIQDIAEQLQKKGCNVHIKTTLEVVVSEASKIVIDDMEGAMLSKIRTDVFEALQKILCSGLPTVWLTSGVNQGKTIFGGMSQGFLRAIRSEQAAAHITLLDVDLDESLGCIVDTLQQKLGTVAAKDSGKDTEFWLHQGVIYVNRLVPNTTLNDRVSATTDATEKSILPAKTALNGKFANGELSFYSREPDFQALSEHETEIQVEASEFQANDVKSDNESPRVVVGKVVRVGSSTNAPMIGQTMAAYTKEHYTTIVRTTEPICVNAAEFDVARLAATLPNLCKAVNCLKAGNVEGGEHALILPTPPPIVGAIAGLSRAFNFEITLVVETKEEKEECFLRYQVPHGSILLADESESIHKLMSRTSAKVPSVVIASDFSPLSQETWRNMPAMGRFVLSDGSIHARPDALPFTKGASFIPTGIGALYRQGQSSAVLRSALHILRAHRQSLVQEPSVRDISALKETKEISDSSTSLDYDVVTYKYGESSVKVGALSDEIKVCPNPLFQIQPSGKELRFSADAAYLLVGCLGGLGRSLITWMMEKGCRNFAFISRSGADKPEAAKVVELIKEAGASAQVFRADATIETDMARVVSAVNTAHPIRGVVHAAMVLQVSTSKEFEWRLR